MLDSALYELRVTCADREVRDKGTEERVLTRVLYEKETIYFEFPW